MPLCFELFSGGDVDFPVFVVIGDHKHLLVELAENCFCDGNCATCVEFAVVFDLCVKIVSFNGKVAIE